MRPSFCCRHTYKKTPSTSRQYEARSGSPQILTTYHISNTESEQATEQPAIEQVSHSQPDGEKPQKDMEGEFQIAVTISGV